VGCADVLPIKKPQCLLGLVVESISDLIRTAWDRRNGAHDRT